MKGERNSTAAERFKAKATPADIERLNAEAKAAREALRSEQADRRSRS